MPELFILFQLICTRVYNIEATVLPYRDWYPDRTVISDGASRCHEGVYNNDFTFEQCNPGY